MKKNQMSAALRENLSKLSEKEKKYFQIMWSKSGVLYITAKPGVAKSAIARAIADKMGFDYADLRLSMVDETDVGLYPSISEVDGNKCLDFVVPRWAIEANSRPTIIHFEELNRATLQVRNAALQLLLERSIGTKFKFNDNVLMMCSGNLGDEDNTDVEEFDAALNNRLIHIKHDLLPEEWIENFAKDNVHPLIVSYIKAYPEQMYQTSENTSAYATPRSWTFLSDYIISNFGEKSDPSMFLQDITKVGQAFVGNSAVKFIKYCQETINLNINDILNRFDEVKKDLKKFNRDKTSELLNSLKEIDLKTLTDEQIANGSKFLKLVSDDELVGYLTHLLDNYDIDEPNIATLMKNFKDTLKHIKVVNTDTNKQN
jgi:hypothetical protein